MNTVIRDMGPVREESAFKRLAQCEMSATSWDTTKCQDYRGDNSLFMRDLAIIAHAALRMKRELDKSDVGYCAACYKTAPLVDGECPDCRH